MWRMLGGGIQINIINYRYLDLCNHNIEMVDLQSKKWPEYNREILRAAHPCIAVPSNVKPAPTTFWEVAMVVMFHLEYTTTNAWVINIS